MFSYSRGALAALIVLTIATTAAAQQAAPAAPPVAPPVAGWNDGFFVQAPNGDYRLQIGMTSQEDGRFSLDDPKPVINTFLIRKFRPTFTGRIAKFFDFKVMPDFGNGQTVVLDAYFDVRFSTKFRIRTGKDKTPIGYELLQGDANLWFPERSLASSLVPNRDTGVQAQGNIGGNRFFYAAGIFNGIPDGTSLSTELDTNNTKDLAGRVVVQPFARTTPATAGPLNGLGFQIGGSTGRQTGALPSFKTSVGQTYFSYVSTAAASGVRDRLSPAVFYFYKSFGAFGEYMRSSQTVAKAGVATDVTNTAWDITGSFALTGDVATYGVFRPKNTFDPANHHWGAAHLVARYTELTIDRAAFTAGLAAAGASRQAKSFTIGVNWFPAPYIKFYGTFERTRFGNSASRPNENVILFRSQIAF